MAEDMLKKKVVFSSQGPFSSVQCMPKDPQGFRKRTDGPESGKHDSDLS